VAAAGAVVGAAAGAAPVVEPDDAAVDAAGAEGLDEQATSKGRKTVLPIPAAAAPRSFRRLS